MKLLAAVESTLATLRATSTTPEDGTPPTPSTFSVRVFPAPIAPPVECVSRTRAGGNAWNSTRAVGVTACDGTRFGAVSSALRLSFAFAEPDQIEAGVERLAAAL